MRFELPENERKVLREIQRQNNKRDYVKATVLLMLDLGETPELGRRNPRAKRIRVFIDNAGYFKKLEKDNLIADQRIEIVWLPTYAPNLNLRF